MFDILRKDYAIINIMIILVAVSPAFALGEGNRNMLLIGAMCLSPYFFIRYPIIIPKVDIPLTLLCFMMITFPLIFHPETMRWSTVLYSCLFCLYFMAFARVLSVKVYSLLDFAQLLKGLIFAYCIVLIIQQFCVLFGLPIFNVSNYTPLEPYKLNSLMSEPSHSARIIPILMYFYILVKERINGEMYVLKERFTEDRKVWLAFLWSVLTMGSATAFIFLLIIVFKVFPSFKKANILLVIVVGILAVSVAVNENHNFDRAFRFAKAVTTLDEQQVIKADGSGAHRIVQSFRGAKSVGLNDMEDWLGHGIDADQKMISNWQSSDMVGGAGMFSMWINYGFLVSVLWWSFTFKVIFQKNNKLVSFLIWFLIPAIGGGCNGQIIWLVLSLSLLYKYLNNGFIFNNNPCL